MIVEDHINDHQNNFLIDDEINSKEEASNNEEGGENQLTPHEQLINYMLPLDVTGTAAHGFRPA
jgi:hypothetical protein